MDGTTHLTIGALTGAAILRAAPALATPLNHSALAAEGIFMGAAAFAALLADVDHPGSLLGRFIPLPAAYQFRGPTAPPKVGRRIPFTQITIWHRGPTHSLVAAGIAGILSLVLFGWIIGLAVLAGYLSHIGVDLLNQSKVMIFWLVWKKPYVKPHFPRWRAGGGWDYLTGLAGAVGLFLLAGPMVAGHFVHMPHVHALKIVQATWKGK